MLVTLISWIIMSFCFICTGILVKRITERVLGYEIRYISSLVMAGIVFCTVYAEIFSLFYKVSLLSLILLILISLISLRPFFKTLSSSVKACFDKIKSDPAVAVCIIAVLAAAFFWAVYLTCLLPGEVEIPGGYDAQNYHIPSIRWIEEYGLVKGLSNLHTRFANNSSFWCLQALFSFSALYKYSLHTVNGYVWIFTFIFCLTGLWFVRKKSFGLSDVLRLLLLGRLIKQGCYMGVPSTDLMPMCLVAYIFISWCSLNEDKQDDEGYALLSILAIFAATIKLSAAFAGLLVIGPLTGLIKDRKWNRLLKYASFALVVTIPFLVRNVMISGYLLYPVYSIDLFNPDWKEPVSVVASEAACIKLYARSIWYLDSYRGVEKSFAEWFPIWYEKTRPVIYGYLAVADLILTPVVCVYLLICIIKKRKAVYDKILYLTCATGFLMFMLSAPSARFGWIWFILLPAICIYTVLAGVICKIKLPSFIRIPVAVIITVLSVFFMDHEYREMIPFYGDDPLIKSPTLITPRDYGRQGEESPVYTIGGYDFYYYLPNDDKKNHLNGYYGFPGTESGATLEHIELRGNDLKEGFRVKAEDRNRLYDFYGNDITGADAKALGIGQ